MRLYSVSNGDHFQVPVTLTGRGRYPGNGDGFSNSPYVNFNDGKVKFDTKWFDNANDNFGTVSGFVPKSLFYSKGYPQRIPFVLMGVV